MNRNTHSNISISHLGVWFFCYISPRLWCSANSMHWRKDHWHILWPQPCSFLGGSLAQDTLSLSSASWGWSDPKAKILLKVPKMYLFSSSASFHRSFHLYLKFFTLLELGKYFLCEGGGRVWNLLSLSPLPVILHKFLHFFFSFSFCLWLWHVEVPWPGTELLPQQWQHRMLNLLCQEITPPPSFFHPKWKLSRTPLVV